MLCVFFSQYTVVVVNRGYIENRNKKNYILYCNININKVSDEINTLWIIILNIHKIK